MKESLIVFKYHRERLINDGINFIRFVDKRLTNYFQNGFGNATILKNKKIKGCINGKNLSMIDVINFNTRNSINCFIFDNKFSKELSYSNSCFIKRVPNVNSLKKKLKNLNFFKFLIFIQILKISNVKLYDFFGKKIKNGNVPFIKQLNLTIKVYFLVF